MLDKRLYIIFNYEKPPKIFLFDKYLGLNMIKMKVHFLPSNLVVIPPSLLSKPPTSPSLTIYLSWIWLQSSALMAKQSVYLFPPWSVTKIEWNIDSIKNLYLQIILSQKNDYFQIFSLMLIQQNDLIWKQCKNKLCKKKNLRKEMHFYKLFIR